MKPTAQFWSGGKDSALALHRLQQEGSHDVKFLVTTIQAESGKVNMHEVPEKLIERQAEETGIPLLKMKVNSSDNKSYENAFITTMRELKTSGVECIAFGDIFLEDLRQYREALLARAGMTSVYPLWKEDTGQLMQEFLNSGFKTFVHCIDQSKLSKEHLGKTIDRQWLEHLPKDVDPCGENGEFHTFCYDGPVFKNEISFQKGGEYFKPYSYQTTDGEVEAGFWYCEVAL